MSARDEAAREAALIAATPFVPCPDDDACPWCKAFRAGWDGGPNSLDDKDDATGNRLYLTGRRAARAYARATAAAQGGGE